MTGPPRAAAIRSRSWRRALGERRRRSRFLRCDGSMERSGAGIHDRLISHANRRVHRLDGDRRSRGHPQSHGLRSSRRREAHVRESEHQPFGCSRKSTRRWATRASLPVARSTGWLAPMLGKSRARRRITQHRAGTDPGRIAHGLDGRRPLRTERDGLPRGRRAESRFPFWAVSGSWLELSLTTGTAAPFAPITRSGASLAVPGTSKAPQTTGSTSTSETIAASMLAAFAQGAIAGRGTLWCTHKFPIRRLGIRRTRGPTGSRCRAPVDRAAFTPTDRSRAGTTGLPLTSRSRTSAPTTTGLRCPARCLPNAPSRQTSRCGVGEATNSPTSLVSSATERARTRPYPNTLLRGRTGLRLHPATTRRAAYRRTDRSGVGASIRRANSASAYRGRNARPDPGGKRERLAAHRDQRMGRHQRLHMRYPIGGTAVVLGINIRRLRQLVHAFHHEPARRRRSAATRRRPVLPLAQRQ